MPLRPRRLRRTPKQEPAARPRPPAGRLEALDGPFRGRAPRPPVSAPPAPVPAALAPARPAPAPPPAVVSLYARFGTAWAALVFAGQLPGRPAGQLDCLHGGPGAAWWIRTDLTLEAAREIASVAFGEIYLPAGDALHRDRGWGGPAGQGRPIAVSALSSVPTLDLVRAAGLHPRAARPLTEAVLLLPGHLVAGITRRVLDLHLEVSYRPVRLTPLFEPDQPGRSSFEVNVRIVAEPALPAFLLAALDRDPFILVCRRAADNLLVRHQLGSPLSDRSLAALAGDAVWVLADPAYGCARLEPLAAAQDGAGLIRRGGDQQLTDAGDGAAWTTSGDSPAAPASRQLSLVPARMSGVPVDAALLDDADLDCLPALLAGEPLAEAAVLIRGRDRHLLTAAGGLLEELPVGEPLYCLGPGSLYAPLGYRPQPALPPAARRALYPTDASTAVVLQPGAALRFDLSGRDPVWTLWADPAPAVDYQLPDSAVADLAALDEEMTHPLLQPPRPARPSQPAVLRPVAAAGTPSAPATRPPRTWRDVAYEAELNEDYATAADLHIQHDDPLRAARLYERAAERG